MLPKSLITRRVFRAAILVPSVVRSLMSPQPRSCHKRLPATLSITDVVPNCGVGALHMVVKVRCSKKRFVAILVAAFVYPLIVVRSDMLCESGRPIERLPTVLERAEMRLQIRWIFRRGGRWRKRSDGRGKLLPIFALFTEVVG